MPKKQTTLDDVLQATKQGFDAMDKHFDKLNKRLDDVETKVDTVYKVVDKWPSPSEIDDLFYRMHYIEKMLGITRKRRARKAA